jgi:hypothetical protein
LDTIIRIPLNDAYDQIGLSLTGYFAQGFGGGARDIDGVGPIPLPGAAPLGAAAADDRVEG